MGLLLYLLIFSLPSLVETVRDPIDGWLPAETAARDLDCEPLSTEGAERLAPGRVPPPEARGDLLRRRAVICRERLMPQGVRRPLDDAILSSLRVHAVELAGLVVQDDRRWLVEISYPQPTVAQKIGFAVKNALLDRGLKVSDRAPTLAAGDVEVLGRLPVDAAWPVACLRYVATGSLRPGDGLLAIVLRDPRETILHAGTCVDGRWRWLR